MNRGREITILEAAGWAGGHARALHDPFAEGLDAGAEHFYEPGYDVHWGYNEEFNFARSTVNLEVRPWTIRNS